MNAEEISEKSLGKYELGKMPYFTVSTLFKAKIPPVQWLVEGLVPESSMALFAGRQGEFKSYLSMYLAWCIATGTPFLNKKVKKGRVLYVDEENSIEEINARFEKLKNTFKELARKPKGNILGYADLEKDVTDNMALMFSKGIKMNMMGKTKLEETIKEFKPIIVIVDSLVRVMDGDENNAGDARKVFNTIKDLSKNFGCSFFFLHHMRKFAQTRTGKVTVDDIRGSSDFTAAPSSILLMNRTDKENHLYEVTQAKSRSKVGFEEPIYFKVEDRMCSDTTEGIFLKITDAPKIEAKTLSKKLPNEILQILKVENITSFKRKEIQDRYDKKRAKSVDRALDKLVEEKILKKVASGSYEVAEPKEPVDFE